MAGSPDLRPSPIAGRWYPSAPERLRESVDAYIRAAGGVEIDGDILAVVAPHAGHLYSGPVAGHAFAAVGGLKPDFVAVVSPMHYPVGARLLTTAHAAYQTPLGSIEVDGELLKALDEFLSAQAGLRLERIAKDPEHSLEIELPFLQRALASDFKLLPVMIHDPSPPVARSLGNGLAKVLDGKNALMVASSDLSHFYAQEIAEKFDREMLRRIANLDPQSVLQAEEEGVGFACGRGAIAAVLWAAQAMGADSARVLNYGTSGDVTGDYSQVVGYGSAVIFTRRTSVETEGLN
jgi:AmmeMemoRadiSam system protein B